jgi:transposase
VTSINCCPDCGGNLRGCSSPDAYGIYQELELEDAILLDFTLDKFPLLKSAYNLCQQLRLWYQKSNIGKNTGILLYELRRWKEKVKRVNIKEFLQVARMIENHQSEIIRYFEKGLTNAKAENLNGKIQRFIANNFGIRNRDFFIYRMQIYFSPAPQKKI